MNEYTKQEFSEHEIREIAREEADKKSSSGAVGIVLLMLFLCVWIILERIKWGEGRPSFFSKVLPQLFTTNSFKTHGQSL